MTQWSVSPLLMKRQRQGWRLHWVAVLHCDWVFGIPWTTLCEFRYSLLHSGWVFLVYEWHMKTRVYPLWAFLELAIIPYIYGSCWSCCHIAHFSNLNKMTIPFNVYHVYFSAKMYIQGFYKHLSIHFSDVERGSWVLIQTLNTCHTPHFWREFCWLVLRKETCDCIRCKCCISISLVWLHVWVLEDL